MCINPEIVSSVENNKKNVLILGLSTFSLKKQDIDGEVTDVLTKSTMSTENGMGVNLKQEYYYQLEPVPLMLYEKLGKKKIDVVIEIGTQKTDEPRNIYLEGREAKTISPREFFEEQLRDKVVEFRSFIIDNKQGDVMPRKIIDIVRSLQEMKEKEDYNLWIDNHGGLRNSQMVLQCILSLLKKDGIQPQETYMLEYSNGAGTVKVAKQANSINEFVSGVNEFLNFGRTQSIHKYFEMNEENSELPKKIQNIADAIQLCDVGSFEQALDDMQEWITTNQQSYKNTYQELFVEYLQSDYGDLLIKDNRTILKEIAWCMEKDFVQQALTLIESKMPGDIIKKGYLTYNSQAEVTLADNTKKTLQKLIDQSKRLNKKAWEQQDNYMLQQFCYTNIVPFDEHGSKKTYIYQDLKHLNQINVDTTKQSPVQIEYQKDHSVDIELDFPKNDEEKVAVLYKFLALHMSLKNQRNLINHANGTDNRRVSAQVLKAAIQKYMELAKELGIS